MDLPSNSSSKPQPFHIKSTKDASDENPPSFSPSRSHEKEDTQPQSRLTTNKNCTSWSDLPIWAPGCNRLVAHKCRLYIMIPPVAYKNLSCHPMMVTIIASWFVPGAIDPSLGTPSHDFLTFFLLPRFFQHWNSLNLQIGLELRVMSYYTQSFCKCQVTRSIKTMTPRLHKSHLLV